MIFRYAFHVLLFSVEHTHFCTSAYACNARFMRIKKARCGVRTYRVAEPSAINDFRLRVSSAERATNRIQRGKHYMIGQVYEVTISFAARILLLALWPPARLA